MDILKTYFVKKFLQGFVKTFVTLLVAQAPVLHQAGIDMTINQEVLVSVLSGLLMAGMNWLKHKTNGKIPL